jgi:SAM-dependent methyltransferase
MASHWSQVHELDRTRGVDELSLVTHHDLPLYYNRFYDRVEQRAYLRAWKRAGVPKTGSCLEIGPGRGRWTRRLLELGLEVTGIDISERAVETLRRSFPGCRFFAGSAAELPVETASVDVVSSVVVLLHLPPEAKAAAIREIGRVLRPGGHAILIESTHVVDTAPHVFPLAAEAWKERFRAEGMGCLLDFGQEYVPVLRSVEWLAHRLARRRRDVDPGGRSPVTRLLRVAHRLASIAPSRRLAVGLSYPVEPLARRCMPRRMARHGVFVFRKHGGEPAP